MCSTGTSPAALRARSIRFPRSQPERSSGCVEMITSSGSYSRSASRSACSGSGSTTAPAGGDARLVEQVERVAQASLGRGAPLVLVDDVAGARCVLRRDDRHAHRALGCPATHRVDQALPGDGLVREHEDVTHAVGHVTSSSARRGLLGLGRRGRSRSHAVRRGRSVLVRAADHLRNLVEVEDRRRRGNLPLERERAPRVRGRGLGRCASSRSCCRGRRASRPRARTTAIEMARFQLPKAGS